jgi:hypothetical protein
MSDRIATVPFAGFYNSWHDSELDHALDMIASDPSGCHPYEEIRDRLFDHVNWQQVHETYARKYCQAFGEEYGVDLKFESLSSPKYYNFETDRIFARISDEEVRRLFDAVDLKALEKLIRDRFTSCSGFISHYPNTLEDWGDLDTWDHNQVGTLVEAYAVQELGRQDEPLDLPILQGIHSEIPYCSLSEGMGNDSEINRLLSIVDYLNKRAERTLGRA